MYDFMFALSCHFQSIIAFVIWPTIFPYFAFIAYSALKFAVSRSAMLGSAESEDNEPRNIFEVFQPV